MKIYLQIFTKEETSFPIKEAISYVIIESFIFEKYTDNEIDDMITSGLLNVFEFSFLSSIEISMYFKHKIVIDGIKKYEKVALSLTSCNLIRF